ncbi:hypothetical protein I9W82_001185 [Candida metapsilosis]|uniref:Uncharacterized protein n=1 Tax=Candida metapsilosis TaxID=273372 RepID=A0A8H8DE00_9ASCO|nr:hypothetical protein I9W82_001185 [Candida metapsilosis]
MSNIGIASESDHRQPPTVTNNQNDKNVPKTGTDHSGTVSPDTFINSTTTTDSTVLEDYVTNVTTSTYKSTSTTITKTATSEKTQTSTKTKTSTKPSTKRSMPNPAIVNDSAHDVVTNHIYTESTQTGMEVNDFPNLSGFPTTNLNGKLTATTAGIKPNTVAITTQSLASNGYLMQKLAELEAKLEQVVQNKSKSTTEQSGIPSSPPTTAPAVLESSLGLKRKATDSMHKGEFSPDVENCSHAVAITNSGAKKARLVNDPKGNNIECLDTSPKNTVDNVVSVGNVASVERVGSQKREGRNITTEIQTTVPVGCHVVEVKNSARCSELRIGDVGSKGAVALQEKTSSASKGAPSVATSLNEKEDDGSNSNFRIKVLIDKLDTIIARHADVSSIKDDQKFDSIFNKFVFPLLPSCWQGQPPGDQEPTFIRLEFFLTEKGKINKSYKSRCEKQLANFARSVHQHLIGKDTSQEAASKRALESELYKRTFSLYYLTIQMLQIPDWKKMKPSLASAGKIVNNVTRFLNSLVRKYDQEVGANTISNDQAIEWLRYSVQITEVEVRKVIEVILRFANKNYAVFEENTMLDNFPEKKPEVKVVIEKQQEQVSPETQGQSGSAEKKA